MKEKRLAGAALYHIIIFAIGIIMVYPLIWMVMSSFKETNTIFTTASSLIPEHFVTDNYANGWKGFAKISAGVPSSTMTPFAMYTTWVDTSLANAIS